MKMIALGCWQLFNLLFQASPWLLGSLVRRR